MNGLFELTPIGEKHFGVPHIAQDAGRDLDNFSLGRVEPELVRESVKKLTDWLIEHGETMRDALPPDEIWILYYFLREEHYPGTLGATKVRDVIPVVQRFRVELEGVVDSDDTERVANMRDLCVRFGRFAAAN